MIDQENRAAGAAAVRSFVPMMVARQPIYDRNLEVYAYELLYRGDREVASASFADGDRATAQVLAGTFVELGIDVVTGGRPAFVNLTRGTISDQMVHLFPTDRIIAEILEDVDADTGTLARVRELKEAGYTIVLDDFVFRDGVMDLLDLADIVKLDVRALDRDRLAFYHERISARGLRLLAEKVETHEEFRFCRELGFDYFQGYFLCRPELVRSRTERQTQVGILDLIAALNDSDSTVGQLEQAISRDAQLSYQLMRYVNSAAFALTVRVSSVQHALMLLGRRMVTAWANMIVLTGFESKPTELLTTALLRARMVESLARSEGCEVTDVHFTAGLFSILDALLDEPMPAIVARLPLGPVLAEALLERKGEVGELLDLVIRYERGDWDGLAANPRGAALRAAYFDALRFAARIQDIRAPERQP